MVPSRQFHPHDSPASVTWGAPNICPAGPTYVSHTFIESAYKKLKVPHVDAGFPTCEWHSRQHALLTDWLCKSSLLHEGLHLHICGLRNRNGISTQTSVRDKTSAGLDTPHVILDSQMFCRTHTRSAYQLKLHLMWKQTGHSQVRTPLVERRCKLQFSNSSLTTLQTIGLSKISIAGPGFRGQGLR